ncbi:MAG: NADP-dependent oxidoreductase [Bryobacteraceae bacterium]
MRALRFERFGAFQDVLQVRDVDRPVPGPGEVLVKVAAAAINPSDTKNVLGRMEGTTLPRTPGRDFAGTLEDGSEVWGSGGDIGFTRDGTHAEFIVVPRAGIAPKPKSLSMVEAAGVGTAFITAYQGLIEVADVKPGEWVLVTGALGSVGGAVIQLAMWKGARTIAVDRGDDPEKLVKEATGGAGVNVVFDCVGGPLFEPCLRSLGQLGRQVNITSVGDRRVSFDLVDFYHHRLTLHGVDSRALDTTACAGILRILAPPFDAGELQAPPIALKAKLDDAIDAYQKVDSGAAGGRSVFVF